MIKNDRQYRITKAQADGFEQTLATLAAAPADGLSPAIRQAQLDATRSQLEELQADIAEYDALRAGKHRVLELTSLAELPRALIQARIASGMTQKELAERLGLQEQAMQRYEATGYASANLARINDVVKALGLVIREEVYLPKTDTSLNAILKRLKAAGLDQEFVKSRLLPTEILDEIQPSNETQGIGLRLSAIVSRVFGWGPALLFGDERPLMPAVETGVRFKVPANAEGRRTQVQAVYARYLATLVLQATSEVEQRPLPTDPRVTRQQIFAAHGELSLRSCLAYAWSHGVAVLPLRDGGGFHGATWRLAGRNVIVLKQNTRSEARWMADLLHEMRHAGEDPQASEFETIDGEAVSRDRRESDEEQAATMFAGDVLLDGRAEALVKMCVQEASGKTQWLKAAIPRVAEREGVRVDALANYMAYRLALQGQNWWGASTNLQATDESPWMVARDFLIERISFGSLGDLDRHLLARALEGE